MLVLPWGFYPRNTSLKGSSPLHIVLLVSGAYPMLVLLPWVPNLRNKESEPLGL